MVQYVFILLIDLSWKEMEEKLGMFRREVLQYKQDFKEARDKLDKLSKDYAESKKLSPPQRYNEMKNMIKVAVAKWRRKQLVTSSYSCSRDEMSIYVLLSYGRRIIACSSSCLIFSNSNFTHKLQYTSTPVSWDLLYAVLVCIQDCLPFWTGFRTFFGPLACSPFIPSPRSFTLNEYGRQQCTDIVL